ncbi:hypothetical protein FZC66_00595 [Priestia megaterium]|nr:hypothetical protein FZC66_00595 [Priestia megaterium]
MNIEQARKEIERLGRYIWLVENYEVNSMETAAIKLYAENQNVSKIAAELNDLGYKVGGRKVASSDVSAILQEKPKDELHEIAQKLFKVSKKKMTRAFG